MPITALQSKRPSQVHADVSGFATRYVAHWNSWLAAHPPARPGRFGEILRAWQATRPAAMRRLRTDPKARHAPPYLDDLLTTAASPLTVIGTLDVRSIRRRSALQEQALRDLWSTFVGLPVVGSASSVGITKAVLLLTDGRIGPALDSQVRKKLGISHPAGSSSWLAILEEVADDIAAFEASHGLLTQAVPSHFSHLNYGRLYDMALGPR